MSATHTTNPHRRVSNKKMSPQRLSQRQQVTAMPKKSTLRGERRGTTTPNA